MISEFAPAKVNLTLRVGKLREDGYHPVDSLVVFSDWGDEVRVFPAADLSLVVSGLGADILPQDETNLALKAARHLASAAGVSDGARLELVKKIPAGGGLGGGSADAAASLRALNHLWGLDWPLDMLAALGADIGSDVPACVWSRPLRMTGRGERIRLIDNWPGFPALLINPGIAVPTGAVFSAFDTNPAGTGKGFRLTGSNEAASILKDLAVATNDLEAPALEVQPKIGVGLAALKQLPDCKLARMSGSGASCFGLFETKQSRDAAKVQLATRLPDWSIFPVEFQGA